MKLADLKKLDDAAAEWMPFDGDDTNEQGLWLHIAPMSSKAYDDAVRKLTRAHTMKKRNVPLTNAELESINREASSTTLLLGWRNLVDEAEIAIPYAVTTALGILEEHYQFFKRVLEMAGELQARQQLVVLDAEKNSQNGASGGASTEAA